MKKRKKGKEREYIKEERELKELKERIERKGIGSWRECYRE